MPTTTRSLVTPEELRQFADDGYISVRGLLDTDEIRALRAAAERNREIERAALSRRDGEGGITRLHLWNEAGEDGWGLVARSRRIVDRMEALLGDEVYYYHSKLNMKEPYTGGAWAWHQDYGYWYNNGCLWPDMASCLIHVDRATRENGCLQVLRGSHKLGRIDHGKVGDQTGADPERVAEAVQRLELVYCEMEPGDAILFHGNVLHRSDQNHSPNPRWAYICCYNTRHNDPYKESKHPRYQPLEKVADEAVRDWARRNDPRAAVN